LICFTKPIPDMKNIIVILLLLCSVYLGMAQEQKSLNNKIYKNENGIWKDPSGFNLIDSIVTVKLKNRKSNLDNLKITGQVLRHNRLGFVDIRVPKGVDIFEFCEKLKSIPEVESVEVNTIGKFGKVIDPGKQEILFLVPNDPLRSNQYYLNQINAYLGWDITTGSNCVSIGVLDSGTD